MKKVGILDYSMGNIASVQAAFNHLGSETFLISEAKDYQDCDLLVLPGVGAFKDAINTIRDKSFDNVIANHVDKNKTFLGICLGMQMMADTSLENGEYQGLGLIKGLVKKIEPQKEEGKRLKVPHVGWSKIQNSTTKSLLQTNGKSFYFVHSYHFETENGEETVAECSFGPRNLTAIVQRDNVIGCQFHPEKSGHAGLELLNQILNLS